MNTAIPFNNKFKKARLFYLLILGFGLNLTFLQDGFAQGSVGIGTQTPNASAALDVVSAAGGVLVPRMTRLQRDAIATPANALLIFNTNDLRFNYFNGRIWVDLAAGVTWFTGQGDPGAQNIVDAKLNDLYLDERTGEIYQRILSGFPPPLLAWMKVSKSNTRKVTVAAISPVATGFSTQNFNFPGVGFGDAVSCSPLFDIPNGIVLSHAWVSAANTVSVKFYNVTGNAIPVAGNYQLSIF